MTSASLVSTDLFPADPPQLQQPPLPPEEVPLAKVPCAQDAAVADLPPPVVRQLILPTDRRNPSLSLYRVEDDKGLKSIHVYYGLELLEIVPDDVADPTFRSMVARLYNARLKLMTLTAVFKLDPKTIRSWGEALLSRDPQRISTMLFGPDAARKRTRQIEDYVRVRWPELISLGCRNYRAKMQEEIAAIFQTRLSGETLRVLMAGLKVPSSPAAAPAEESSAAAAAAAAAAEVEFPSPPVASHRSHEIGSPREGSGVVAEVEAEPVVETVPPSSFELSDFSNTPSQNEGETSVPSAAADSIELLQDQQKDSLFLGEISKLPGM